MRKNSGSYDDEPATVSMMHEYMEHQGYELDITDKRFCLIGIYCFVTDVAVCHAIREKRR